MINPFLMIKYKLCLLLLCFCINRQASIAQSHTIRVIVFDKEPKDSLTFTNNWAYPWWVTKDNDGRFHKNTDGKITKKDTSHLHFTAHCKTNVQGGYEIRYCYCKRKADGINLGFSDGEPAFASEFNVCISDGKFTFTPKIIYPELISGLKTVYKTTKAKLVLYNKDYYTLKVVSGYIDAEFTETTTSHSHSEKHQYYFRGFFKTPVKS